MSCLCDLHMHSTASDGQYHPAELVRQAKDRGLEAIALTDHDTVRGYDEAAAAGAELGVRVLSGVEMSAREYHTFHILGYCFNPDTLRQSEWFQGLQQGRGERKVRIMDYLRKHGVDFPLSEVDEIADGAVIGRPHFARVMLKRGICRTWEEVFDRYLDTDEFHQKVERKPPAEKCIRAVHDAGGIVSLAHPYQTGLDGADLDALVCRMKDAYGLDAIECWHNGHTQERVSFYLSLAKKYDLIVTGGSDYHGEKVKEHVQMARLTLDLDRLLEIHQAWQRKA